MSSRNLGELELSKRSSFIEVDIEDVEGSCAVCGSRCWVCSHRARTVQTLQGSWALRGRGRKCSNPECPEEKRREPPWKWWHLNHFLVTGSGYGLDVLCHIGRRYLVESVSLPMLHKELSEKYGLRISERHVSNLFRLFLSLVEGRNLAKRCVHERLRAQGGIILSADAVTFDEASPSLFVARDIISGEILFVKRLDGADGKRAELYSEVFRKIKACGIPVRGIVTDKEGSLLTAVREVFSGVPHQLCQTHYLQNLRRLFDKELSELAQAVREVLKSTKEAEREFKASSCDKEEKHLVLELSRVIKTQAKTKGDKLTNPSAFKRYQRLMDVFNVVEKARSKAGSWLHLNRLSGILSGLSHKQDLAKLVEKQLEVVRNVAHILKAEEGGVGSEVAQRLQEYLDGLEAKEYEFPDFRWTSFVNGGRRLADRYWAGLFQCYDVPDLPSTNNALESLFGAVKRQQRKVTGKTTTSGGPIETCAAYVLGAWSTAQQHPDLVSLLEGIPESDLTEARSKLEKLAEPAKLKRSIAREPDGYLGGLLEDWFSSSGHS